MKVVQIILLILLLISIAQTQQTVWIRTHRAYTYGTWPDVATDSRNNVIVTAYPYLIKYDLNGEIIWEKEINFGVWKSSIVVDKGDSIIIGGGFDPGVDSIWYIMKFTPNGESLWRKTFVLPGPFYPIFSDLGIDKQNNILVTGYTPGTYDSNWLTFKLTPLGEIIWERTFSSNWGPDKTTGICADDSQNVIVGGARGIPDIPRSWYPQVYKYSPTGDSLWTVYYQGDNHNYEVGELVTDRFGNVILPGTENKPYLFKYDPQGNYMWQWFDDTISSPFSEFNSCITDSQGNIFVAGARWLSYDTVKVEIKKFQPDGESIWTFIYPLGIQNVSEIYWFKIDMGKNGNIIVAANKDSFVYVLKIAEHSGVVDDKTENMKWFVNPTTILTYKRNFQINLPYSVSSFSIYNIAGTLISKIKANVNERLILNTSNIQLFSEGIYFIKIEGKKKELIKVIILN